jgi:hypothetical protein
MPIRFSNVAERLRATGVKSAAMFDVSEGDVEICGMASGVGPGRFRIACAPPTGLSIVLQLRSVFDKGPLYVARR